MAKCFSHIHPVSKIIDPFGEQGKGGIPPQDSALPLVAESLRPLRYGDAERAQRKPLSLSETLGKYIPLRYAKRRSLS